MASPRNPIEAVTHPDPYQYYAALAPHKPIYRDEALGMWIAASAEAVTAVLASDRCRVRPPTEPVPAPLLGSPVAEVFRKLVRMNDGPGHCPFKQAVSSTLAVDLDSAAAEAEQAAAHLAQLLRPELDGARIDDFALRLPVYVLASLLGVEPAQRGPVAQWTGEFVRCLAPSGTHEQIDAGSAAALRLREALQSLLGSQTPGARQGLLLTLAAQARELGLTDPDAVVANGIGFLMQSYEATAGLIGNTLVALGRDRALRVWAGADPRRLREVILEVLRHDPPIQNTRRFAATDLTIAGGEVRAGEPILVVLAAANRDADANPDPDRFDADRRGRRIFTFGSGIHACPGEALAVAIARAGIARLLTLDVDLPRLAATVRYRPSANARIPVFAASHRSNNEVSPA